MTETTTEENTQSIGGERDSEYIIVLDSFGGDWTPVAAVTDASEAIALCEMLEADADAVCVNAPYYETKEDVRDGKTSTAPLGLETVSVAFSGKDVVAISDNDWAAREAQIKHGGLRTEVSVYDTAAEVAVDKPSVVGGFIVSQLTAEDIMNAIQ